MTRDERIREFPTFVSTRTTILLTVTLLAVIVVALIVKL